MYCKKCGGKVESYASHCAFCGAPVEKYDSNMNYVKEEKQEVKPKRMTTLKWLGFYLLPFIPVIGWLAYFILLLKWAFGRHKDSTLKTYARAQLIVSIVLLVLIVIYLCFVTAVAVAVGALAEGFAEVVNQIADVFTY